MRHSALANINRKNLPKSVASIGFILTMSKSLHNFWWKMENPDVLGRYHLEFAGTDEGTA